MSTRKFYELSTRIEAYSTFELASSLVFGFSVSVLFGSAKKENFTNEILEIIFTIFMCLALVASAYSFIAMSITHYFISRYMADDKYYEAMDYLNHYHNVRKYGRWALYVSIICLVLSLIFYVYPQLNIISAIISVIMLGSGVLFLAYTMYIMLNPHIYVQHSSYNATAQADNATAQADNATQIKKYRSMIASGDGRNVRIPTKPVIVKITTPKGTKHVADAFGEFEETA
eukprot:345190_1